jgi:hypothetical protein
MFCFDLKQKYKKCCQVYINYQNIIHIIRYIKEIIKLCINLPVNQLNIQLLILYKTNIYSSSETKAKSILFLSIYRFILHLSIIALIHLKNIYQSA